MNLLVAQPWENNDAILHDMRLTERHHSFYDCGLISVEAEPYNKKQKQNSIYFWVVVVGSQTLHPLLRITQIRVFGLNINSIIRAELLWGVAGGERRLLLPPAILLPPATLTGKHIHWPAAIRQ